MVLNLDFCRAKPRQRDPADQVRCYLDTLDKVSDLAHLAHMKEAVGRGSTACAVRGTADADGPGGKL
jgi:hypothetical protein